MELQIRNRHASGFLNFRPFLKLGAMDGGELQKMSEQAQGTCLRSCLKLNKPLACLTPLNLELHYLSPAIIEPQQLLVSLTQTHSKYPITPINAFGNPTISGKINPYFTRQIKRPENHQC